MANVFESYESSFAEMIDRTHAISFAYARRALAAILTALEFKEGDEIVLSPLTCKVVPAALLSVGVRPVYADIDPRTLNLSTKTAKAAFGLRTRAVLFQHTYGISAGIDEMAILARSRGIHLIEDCAQCPPHLLADGDPGTSGIAAIWSHNLRKPLSAGSGAFATTNDDGLAEKLRAARDAGSVRGFSADIAWRLEAWVQKKILTPERYWFFLDLAQRLRGTYREMTLEETIKSEIEAAPIRPSPYQAAWGLAALGTAAKRAEYRRHLAEQYRRRLVMLHRIQPLETRVTETLYYFPILVDDKAAFLAAARAKKCEVIAWPIAMPIYPIESPIEAAAFGYRVGSCAHADRVARHLVGLPLDLDTQPHHVDHVVELIREHELHVHHAS